MAQASPVTPYIPGSTVEAGAVRAGDEPVGTIAIPVRDFMHTETVLSLLSTNWGGMPIDTLIHRGNVLTMQRNSLIERMRGDWIFFIDDDMVWQRDDPARLIQSLYDLRESGNEPDILGALCHRRQAPYQPTLYVRDGAEGPYNYLEDWEGRYIEVDATGMAFCIVTKACLERIAGTEMPSYEERIAHARHPDFFRWQRSLGEDLRFCQDVRSAGGRIIVDTAVRIDHMGEARLGYRDFLKEVAERPAEVTKMRRSINRAMGIPTLSASEARKRLRAID